MATNGKIFETELAKGSSDPKYLRAISSDGKSVKVLASQFAKQTTQTQINTRVTTLEGEVDELQATLPAQVAQIGLKLGDLTQRSNKFLRLAVMIDSTNGILSIGGKTYKLIPTTDTPTWDLDYNDFVTKSASDNPEFSYVLVDENNKILYGVYNDGTTIDNSSMVEGETIGGFDLISIINNFAATYNYD